MRITTKELSVRTWPDFEALFTKGQRMRLLCLHGVPTRSSPARCGRFPDRAAMQVENLAQKREHVYGGRAHGILVYADGEVVGWCQYGPVDELPIGGKGKPGPTDAEWRITCLVTDKAHRNRGASLTCAACRTGVDPPQGWRRRRVVSRHLGDRRSAQEDVP